MNKWTHNTRLAKIVAGLAILMNLAGIVAWLLLSDKAYASFAEAVNHLGSGLVITLTMAPLGALIVVRRPGNIVGWLLLLIALAAANPAAVFVPGEQPPALTPAVFLPLWLEGWSWIPLIFGIFLIPLYFPSGTLPSMRWKWLPRLALAMWIFFAAVTLFITEGGPVNESWAPLPNPIGFVPQAWFNDTFFAFWFAGLMTLLGGSVISLFVRYRHAGFVERQQIKWLLLAGGQFVVVYSIAFFNSSAEDSGNIFMALLMPSAMAVPAAVAIAILRYRLYDIDVLIRKTLIYGLLSGTLALVYFGSVVLLQQLTAGFGGRQSPVAIVISTLLIAALFSPLRRRAQELVDRRFYRSNYDSAQTLDRFARAARDEVNLDQLAAELLQVVEETMRPETASIWLKAADSDRAFSPDPGD